MLLPPNPFRTAATALLALSAACSSDPSPTESRAFSASDKPRFSHEQHVHQQHLQCIECHHEIDAARLDTPHDAYLSASGIDCRVCHQGTSRRHEPQTCANCHPITPTDVADETLSAKVVIHRTCWRCHPTSDGATAADGCGTCHGRAKPRLARQIPPPSLRRKGAK